MKFHHQNFHRYRGSHSHYYRHWKHRELHHYFSFYFRRCSCRHRHCRCRHPSSRRFSPCLASSGRAPPAAQALPQHRRRPADVFRDALDQAYGQRETSMQSLLQNAKHCGVRWIRVHYRFAGPSPSVTQFRCLDKVKLSLLLLLLGCLENEQRKDEQRKDEQMNYPPVMTI